VAGLRFALGKAGGYYPGRLQLLLGGKVRRVDRGVSAAAVRPSTREIHERQGLGQVL